MRRQRGEPGDDKSVAECLAEMSVLLDELIAEEQGVQFSLAAKAAANPALAEMLRMID